MTLDKLLQIINKLLLSDVEEALNLLKINNLNYGFDALSSVCMEETLCWVSSNMSKYMRYIDKAFVYCIYDDGMLEKVGATEHKNSYNKIVEVRIIGKTRPCNVYVKTIFDQQYRCEQEFSMNGRMFKEIVLF